MVTSPNILPILFDRAGLRARLHRARRLGPATFLLDRVAADMAERLHAVLREFNNAADIGTTFGLAYNRVTKTVYASAMHKVYAGFGPGGSGAIYGISATSDTANSTTVTTVTSAPAASANGVANSNGAASNSATKTVTTTTNVPAATVFATIPEAGTDARSAFVI